MLDSVKCIFELLYSGSVCLDKSLNCRDMEEMNKLTAAQTLQTYFYTVKCKPLGQPDGESPEQVSEA